MTYHDASFCWDEIDFVRIRRIQITICNPCINLLRVSKHASMTFQKFSFSVLVSARNWLKGKEKDSFPRVGNVHSKSISLNHCESIYRLEIYKNQYRMDNLDEKRLPCDSLPFQDICTSVGRYSEWRFPLNFHRSRGKVFLFRSW